MPNCAKNFTAAIKAMHRKRRQIRMLCMMLVLPLVCLPTLALADINLIFGTYSSDKPTDVVAQHKPFLDVISQNLSVHLGEPVTISLHIVSDYEDGIANLVDGSVDLARFGPASYVIAKARNSDIGIIAMETVKGQKTFKGVIAVRVDSPITTLEQLRDQRFAFGNELSTIGRFLAQAELLRAGINAEDLRSYAYLGRHDRVGTAVGQGDFEAGALKSSTFVKLRNKDVPIRILVDFDNVTKPWLHRSGLDTKIVAALIEVFVTFDDLDALSAISKTGFVPGIDADYQPIREAMQESESFGG